MQYIVIISNSFQNINNNLIKNPYNSRQQNDLVSERLSAKILTKKNGSKKIRAVFFKIKKAWLFFTFSSFSFCLF